MNIVNRRFVSNKEKLKTMPLATLRKYFTLSDNANVLLFLLAHPDLPVSELENAMRGFSCEEKMAAIASNPNCTDEMLRELFKSKKEAICCKIASNPSASPELLNRIAALKLPSTHLPLARNQNTALSALRLIAVVSKDPLVYEALSCHEHIISSGPHELINMKHHQALKNVAEKCCLTTQEMAKLWQCGGTIRLALLTNMNLTETLLKKFLSIASDIKDIAAIAKHPALSQDVIVALSKHDDFAVVAGVAANPSAPESLLDKLSCNNRGGIALAAASNTAVSAAILHRLSLHQDVSVRVSVATHENTEEKTLDLLSKDKADVVRIAVAKNKNTPLKTLKRLSGDTCIKVSSAVAQNGAMGVVMELSSFYTVLKSSGYGAFSFYKEMSPKRATKLLINSKHPSEVAFIFKSKDARSVGALSALQAAFTNHKGKLNRDDYLRFVDSVNQHVPSRQRAGLDVDFRTLATVRKFFSDDLIIDIACQFEPDEAKDTLRMLSDQVSYENKNVNRDNQARVLAWLSDDNTTTSLHNYLVISDSKAWVNRMGDFKQKQYVSSVDAVNAELPKHWAINLPTNARELMAIGDAQSHCVGSQHYAVLCESGARIIFQLFKNNDVRHGYTFEFTSGGSLIQAKGFANSSVPSDMVRAARKAFYTLRKNKLSSEVERVAA